MFYTLAILGIFIAVAAVAVDRFWRLPRWGRIERPTARLRALEVGLYGAVMLSFLALALTGFGGWLASGHLVGIPLLLHMFAGGLFATVLPLFLVALAGGAAAQESDNPRLLGAGEKVVFWLAMTFGWLSLGTVMLTMLPLFATGQIETLLAAHRYSGLAMVVLLIPHIYTSWQSRGIVGEADTAERAAAAPAAAEGFSS